MHIMTSKNDFILYHGSTADLSVGEFLDPKCNTRQNCESYGFPLVWATPYKSYAMAFAIEKAINRIHPNDFCMFNQERGYAFSGDEREWIFPPCHCSITMFRQNRREYKFDWLKENLWIYKVNTETFYEDHNRKPVVAGWEPYYEFEFQFYSIKPVEIIAKEKFNVFDFLNFDNSVWHNL